uniref:Uncharacterized protein n=1 Tax=Arundo donax TaxID=35708 RepID=A0A0A9ASL1_ARUDO
MLQMNGKCYSRRYLSHDAKLLTDHPTNLALPFVVHTNHE